MKQAKIKILVVDDSDIILKILKGFFSIYYVQIITSRNGLEGIKKALETKPDIILLDLLMPNFDGIKMLQVIKLMDNLKQVPVIVISGNTDKVNVLTAMESGADKVLAKPLKKDVLIDVIQKLLGKELPLNSNSFMTSHVERDNEIILQLKKLFVENFYNEKDKIEKAITGNNPEPLKRFARNAKSVSISISYPQLKKINFEIEKILNKSEIDWQLLKIRFNQFSAIIKDLENSLAVW